LLPDHHLGMPGAEVPGNETRKWRFVAFATLVKGHREAVKIGVTKLSRGRSYRAGIDTAAEQDANRHIRGDKPLLGCRAQQFLKFVRVIAVRIKRFRVEFDRPEFSLHQLPVDEIEGKVLSRIEA